MSRSIVIRDGVIYDNMWNAITPTSEELTAIAETVAKYTDIATGEASGREVAL